MLLFFLIVATVANPQVIKLALPSSDQAEGGTAKPVYLTVSKDKEYYVGDNKSPVTWAEVEPALTQSLQGITDPTVVLRVEKELDVQSLVDVLDLGMRLRVKMVLQTSTN